jgi:hypothetical protein
VDCGFPLFGSGPEEILKGLRDFASEQAGSVSDANREAFAAATLSAAVDLTAAALQRIPTNASNEQALVVRDALWVIFPEAVAMVSAVHQGVMGELAGGETPPSARPRLRRA